MERLIHRMRGIRKGLKTSARLSPPYIVWLVQSMLACPRVSICIIYGVICRRFNSELQIDSEHKWERRQDGGATAHILKPEETVVVESGPVILDINRTTSSVQRWTSGGQGYRGRLSMQPYSRRSSLMFEGHCSQSIRWAVPFNYDHDRDMSRLVNRLRTKYPRNREEIKWMTQYRLQIPAIIMTTLIEVIK